MTNEIENRMVVDSEWSRLNSPRGGIAVCECCEESIKQFRALRILSGTRKIWICDRCIEDMKEVTRW